MPPGLRYRPEEQGQRGVALQQELQGARKRAAQPEGEHPASPAPQKRARGAPSPAPSPATPAPAPTTLPTSRAAAGMETIMLLVARWFDAEAPAGLAHADGAKVERLLRAAEGHGLSRSQRERPQIAAFLRAARRAYPELEERKRQVGKFCVALAATLHATSANHMKDAAAGLDALGTPADFERCFASYASANVLVASLETVSEGDVFNEFSWNGRNNADGFAGSERKLAAFLAKHEASSCPKEVGEFQRSIKGKVLFVGGKLFVFMAIAAFAELGLVSKDAAFRDFLPTSFTETSGALAMYHWASGRGEAADDAEFCAEIRRMLPRLPAHITALDVENVLCKAHVLAARI